MFLLNLDKFSTGTYVGTPTSSEFIVRRYELVLNFSTLKYLGTAYVLIE